MNPGATVILWIVVGAAAGWLASRITGIDGRHGALANVFSAVLGALVAGTITRIVLARLGHETPVLIGVAAALFGACVVVFGAHARARRHLSD